MRKRWKEHLLYPSIPFTFPNGSASLATMRTQTHKTILFFFFILHFNSKPYFYFATFSSMLDPSAKEDTNRHFFIPWRVNKLLLDVHIYGCTYNLSVFLWLGDFLPSRRQIKRTTSLTKVKDDWYCNSLFALTSSHHHPLISSQIKHL